MSTDHVNAVVASKPKVISETDTTGVYEISRLYPGYGNTLGNALRRMLLSSIPGAAITSVRIKDVPHEFATMSGVKDDVLMLVLNLKRVQVKVHTESGPFKMKLKKKGVGKVTAGDFETPSQVEVVNKDFVIAEITDAKGELEIEAEVNVGIGFRPREDQGSEDTGVIHFDATFSPIKRTSYEVSNMRVGDRTDFNKLCISIQTNGTVSPHAALDTAIRTMVKQLEAMVSFQRDDGENIKSIEKEVRRDLGAVLVSDLKVGTAVVNLLQGAGINTVDDILKKGMTGVREIQGIGDKAVSDITAELEERGIVFKEE